MSLKIKVEIVEIGSDTFVALFRGLVEGEDIDPDQLPMVSLSRVHGKCHYRVDQMHQHDHHAPVWNDMKSMNEYIQRVLDEVRDGCIQNKIVIANDVQKVKLPNPFKGNPNLN